MNVNDQFLLREGSTNIAHYGIRLAEIAGIPASVVSHARLIAAKIDAKVCSLPKLLKFGWTDQYKDVIVLSRALVLKFQYLLVL